MDLRDHSISKMTSSKLHFGTFVGLAFFSPMHADQAFPLWGCNTPTQEQMGMGG